MVLHSVTVSFFRMPWQGDANNMIDRYIIMGWKVNFYIGSTPVGRYL